MRCRQHRHAKAHPYALLYHLAAHVVLMDRLNVPLISVRVHPRRRIGAVYALMQLRDPWGSRMLVERDAVCAYAGVVAEEHGCGRSSWFTALEDGSTASKRIARFTQDIGEQAAWETYLRERACVAVRAAWHEITVIAAVLQRERALDGASVAATLEAFRRNPFRSDLRPLRPIPWAYPTPTRDAGPDEVELLYTKPRLSALVARVVR